MTMSLFGFLGERKPDRTEQPTYQASQYDAPSAKTIYDYYSTRAQGKDLGWSDETLGTLRGEAVDQSAQAQREYQRVAGQSPYTSRGTGGVYSGQAQKMQERAVSQGLTLKSQALRDISLRNEILKKTEQAESVQGLQGFLNSERNQANQLYNYQYKQFQYDDSINQAINAWKTSQRQGWINVGETVAKSAISSYNNPSTLI